MSAPVAYAAEASTHSKHKCVPLVLVVATIPGGVSSSTAFPLPIRVWFRVRLDIVRSTAVRELCVMKLLK